MRLDELTRTKLMHWQLGWELEMNEEWEGLVGRIVEKLPPTED
jgi:hypothetical protein